MLSRDGRGVLGIADPEWMARQAITTYRFTVRPLTEVVAALTEAALSVERVTLQIPHPFHLLVCRSA